MPMMEDRPQTSQMARDRPMEFVFWRMEVGVMKMPEPTMFPERGRTIIDQITCSIKPPGSRRLKYKGLRKAFMNHGAPYDLQEKLKGSWFYGNCREPSGNYCARSQAGQEDAADGTRPPPIRHTRFHKLGKGPLDPFCSIETRIS